MSSYESIIQSLIILSISVAHSWINNIATGVVNSIIGCLIYAVFLILEMNFLWISCNHYSLTCAIYINVP